MAELKDVFGDSDRLVTFEDLQNLNYLEQVIKETWRLYPPIPFIGRKPTADLELGRSYLISGLPNSLNFILCTLLQYYLVKTGGFV